MILMIIPICMVLISCSKTRMDSNPQSGKATKDRIISDCFDHQNKFKPVLTIRSRTSYLEKAYDYRPVESAKGFIAWDFTLDGKLDYIFIEKMITDEENKQTYDSSKIRLVICGSNTKKDKAVNYARIMPHFSLYESYLPDFQAESYKISVVAKKLIIRRNYHEHNWGSDETINTYLYDTNRKDFYLAHQDISSTSGDGYRNDIFESYDHVLGIYSKKHSCGAYVGPCKPLNITGRFRTRLIYLSSAKDIFSPAIQHKDLL